MIKGYNIFNGAKCFSSGIFQNYLVFRPAKNRLNTSVALLDLICENLMDGNITKSDINFAANFVDHHVLLDINFKGHCLINYNISIPKKVVNLYISYILIPWLINLNRFHIK